ncbi:MAG: N-acetylmuramoyl-L-alanine amidase-like domain-containing protein, partial [Ignavibacteriaceae bacterium]
TLEVNDEEKLVINLSGLDCNTFVENVLVLSRCIKQGKTSFDDFKAELTLIRYRDGKIDQYPSRLHYFTDWIFNNEEKIIVKNITEEIDGEKFEMNLSFMSSHPEYYKHLKATPGFIPLIKKQEEEINKREHYFIPQEKIAAIEPEIKSGDLLAFTTTIKGLDVNHVGIAVKMKDDRIHVLHAPNVGYKVQISKLPLAEYVYKIEKDSGVIVVSVLEPAE